MAFTDAQKTDIRRYCGMPAYGGTPDGFNGWRFYQAYGALEYRMNNLSTAEESVVTTTYLPNLNTLENAIPAAGANLDTERAGPWQHNQHEVRDRIRLFNDWRRRLCAFLGIPPGPGLQTIGSCIV